MSSGTGGRRPRGAGVDRSAAGDRHSMPERIAASPYGAAAWTGFTAAAVGAFVAVVLSVLFWIPDAGATGSSGSTVHAGVLTFLAAQHGGLVLSGVPIGFVPFGLTLLSGWLCWRAVTVLCRLPVLVARPVTSGGLGPLFGVHVLAYALTCLVLVPLGRVGTSHAPAVGVLFGSVVVCAVSSGAGLARHTGAGALVWTRLPPGLRAAVRGGIGAVCTALAAGALLTLGSLIAHAGRFLDFSRALGGGVSGLPIAALGLAAAPNLVLAGSAYLFGPGFALGAGGHYSVLSTTPGLAPALPPLAVLPAQDASTPVLGLALVSVLATGLIAGRLAARDADRATAALGRALGAAGVAGVVLALAAALTGGSLGQARLARVGVSWWRFGLTAAGLVAIGASLCVLVQVIVRHYRHDTGPRLAVLRSTTGDRTGSSAEPKTETETKIRSENGVEAKAMATLVTEPLPRSVADDGSSAVDSKVADDGSSAVDADRADNANRADNADGAEDDGENDGRTAAVG